MADDLLIQPLDLTDFADPGQGPDPGFTELVASELADAGTDADGFDAVVEEMQGFIDAFDAGLAELAGADGGDLDTTFAEILTLDPEAVRANAADFAAALPAGDQAVEDLGNLLAGSTPAPPAGGGAAASNTFDFGSSGPIGRTCHYTFTYTNNTGKTDTVTKWTLENDSAAAFAVQWPTPVTLANGESTELSVAVTATQLGPHEATFSIYTSNEAPPFVLQFIVHVVAYDEPCPGGPPPGGPGHGGGGRGKLT